MMEKLPQRTGDQIQEEMRLHDHAFVEAIQLLLFSDLFNVEVNDKAVHLSKGRYTAQDIADLIREEDLKRKIK